LHDAAIAELGRRQIDGDFESGQPGHGLGASPAQHPFTERHDQPDLLGERDELRLLFGSPSWRFLERQSAGPNVQPR
jgi:hypothetical protein